MWKLIKKSGKWSHSRWSAKTSKWFRALALPPALINTSLLLFLSVSVALQRSPLLPRNAELSAFISHTHFVSVRFFLLHSRTRFMTWWALFLSETKKTGRQQQQQNDPSDYSSLLVLFNCSTHSQLIKEHDKTPLMLPEQIHQQRE